MLRQCKFPRMHGNKTEKILDNSKFTFNEEGEYEPIPRVPSCISANIEGETERASKSTPSQTWKDNVYTH